MGYRSLVAYTIRFEDDFKDGTTDGRRKESFYTFLAEAKAKIPALWTGGEDSIHTWLHVVEDKFQFNFHTPHDIKWYPDYDEVKAHMALWELAREFHEDNECIVGQYIETGEADDDVTIKEFGEADDVYIRLSRKISCDWLDEKVE